MTETKRETTFAEFCHYVHAYQRQYPEQRNGQAHWNYLERVRPTLARYIRETCDCDPFYQTYKLPLFLNHVAELWNIDDSILHSALLGD